MRGTRRIAIVITVGTVVLVSIPVVGFFGLYLLTRAMFDTDQNAINYYPVLQKAMEEDPRFSELVAWHDDGIIYISLQPLEDLPPDELAQLIEQLKGLVDATHPPCAVCYLPPEPERQDE